MNPIRHVGVHRRAIAFPWQLLAIRSHGSYSSHLNSIHRKGSLSSRGEKEIPFMGKFTMRRISHAAADAADQVQQLCRQLSEQAEVVSPRSKALTEQLFGKALTPAQVVDRICSDVRQHGLPAVLRYTEQLDRVRLTRETLRVSAEELSAAHKA